MATVTEEKLDRAERQLARIRAERDKLRDERGEGYRQEIQKIDITERRLIVNIHRLRLKLT